MALADVVLDVREGEIVALLGASGSGKSTLLNAVAGLVDPSKGEIWIAGQRVAADRYSTPPEQRDVGMVFQNFALWPHLSVLETVAYPMRRAGRPPREASAAAADLLLELGIPHLGARRPAELSGGEQQRVGLARALARDARLYLLDEPTAHLDTHLRTAFQESVRARQHDTGAAVVYATHDATEALGLADRVALMVGGRLIQTATPDAVYGEPVSLAAAVLAGSCSVLDAQVRGLPDGGLSVDFGDGPVRIDAGGGATREPRPGRLLVRPDWVHVGGPLGARVVSVAFRGAHTDYHLESSAGLVLMTLQGPPRFRPGDGLPWGLSRVWLLDADDCGALPQPSAVIAAG